MPGIARLARLTVAVAAALGLSAALGAASASAVTYYATPNPNPGAACTQADPCAIEQATSAPPNSEVVILPGEYTVTGSAGLNSFNTADIHGVFDQPRPRINVTNPSGAAWSIGLSDTDMQLRHVELVTAGVFGLSTSGNANTASVIVEDVIVRQNSTHGIACSLGGTNGTQVTFKNTICQGTTTGLGAICVGCHNTVTLRNVTAVGGTNGINFDSSFGSPSTYAVSAFNVIARHTGGTGADVAAGAHTQNSSSVISLDHSNYATRSAVADCAMMPCTATVTDPNAVGANNQTAAPAFVDAAAGDFHQLPGSPTVDAGADDAANGTADIDGQQRDILTTDNVGDTTDIGADELGRATTTSVSCSPSALAPAAVTTCTATVTDVSPSTVTAPTGTVAFSTSGGGGFGASSCSLAATATPGQSSCSVTYQATQPGSHAITATSPRDVLHEGSQGTASLAVSTPAASTTENPECATLRAKLQRLTRKIKQTDDPDRKAKLKKKRRKVRNQLAALGCP